VVELREEIICLKQPFKRSKGRAIDRARYLQNRMIVEKLRKCVVFCACGLCTQTNNGFVLKRCIHVADGRYGKIRA